MFSWAMITYIPKQNVLSVNLIGHYNTMVVQPLQKVHQYDFLVSDVAVVEDGYLKNLKEKHCFLN